MPRGGALAKAVGVIVFSLLAETEPAVGFTVTSALVG